MVLLLSHFVYGQDSSKFSIGIHGGPSFVSWYNNSGKGLYNSRLELMQGGVGAQYTIKPWFILCTEINYERKGRNLSFGNAVLYDGVPNHPILVFKGTLDYIVIPMVAKFKLGKKKISCFVNGGTYLGCLVKAELYSFPNGKDSPSNYNRFDIGLVNGLGIDIAIRKHFQFSIELRNNLGIRKVLKNEIANSKNESFALLLGLAYKI